MRFLKDVLHALVLLGLVVVLGLLSVSIYRSGTLVLHADSSVQEVQAMAQTVREYTQEQIAHLRDPKQAKAIDAGLQLAAAAKGSVELINRQVIPRAMKTLDSVNETVQSLNGAVGSVNALIEHLDDNLNGDILPGLGEAVSQMAPGISELRDALKAASDKAAADLDAIHVILADPSLQASQQTALDVLKHLDGVMANVHKAAESAPAIAGSVDKIAATSAKWQKAGLIVGLASTAISAILKWIF